MAAIDDQIAQLETILNAGVESVTVDGVTTRYNVAQVRQRLRELCRLRDRRSQTPTIRLSGGFDTY